MGKWTESKALSVLQHDGFEVVTGKFIRKQKTKGGINGSTGLNKCSAIDYLVKFCGYKF
jgi:hypothetical protein